MEDNGITVDGGRTRSVWMGVDVPDFERGLRRDVRCQVCIIGGGITGLSVAYELTLLGKRVVVIDDGPIGAGETARTSAHLASLLDTRYAELERLHGVDKVRLIGQSHRAAIDRIGAISVAEGIDCGFARMDGYLFASAGGYRRGEVGELEAERDAARRAGFAGVDVVGQVPMSGAAFGPALRVPHQAHFQPLAYLAGLVRAIERKGGRVISHVRATAVEDGVQPQVITAGGVTIHCEAVVVATHTPFVDRVVMHTKLAGYRTYVVGMLVARGQVPPMLLWDTDDPYHYVRVVPGEWLPLWPQPGAGRDLLIVGGQDHKTGQDGDPTRRFERLEHWARQRFPGLGQRVAGWSGQVMNSVDGVAFIGCNPRGRNVYIATGYAGNGLTHGAIAGLMLPDLIAGRVHPWAALYDPRRRTLKAAPRWLRENLNAAAQYRDWLTPGEREEIARVGMGEAAIVRRGARKLAVYRDREGMLYVRSAACPHLGAVVRWNRCENTWDCPAHGSRFDADGRVLHGPCGVDLPPVGHPTEIEVPAEDEERTPAVMHPADAGVPGDS
jgi:glycine/D-amino acid oxidase-like deaminating enzyme/nitrite reductase/ring-hydroxylating ferredoxin subunit